MRIVPINCVKPGTLLAKTLYGENGTILLKKGVELTAALTERIKENGIYSVFIDDGYSHEIIEDIIKPELRQKAIQTIRDTFSQIEKSNALLDADSSFKKKMHKAKMSKYIQSLKGICEYIVDDITKSSVLMINLVDIKNIGSYHYQHALNVALISTIIGIELNYNKHDLYNLFIGAVLHDIGKAFISPEILAHKPPYTHEQIKSLQSHAELGHRYIRNHFTLEAPSSVVILQHHERYDGTGYPNNTAGEHLHKNSRIVALANLYDDLTSDTLIHKAIPANEVMELIMASGGRAFDSKLVEIFVRKIYPYPVGSLIMLSNHRLAAVKADNYNYPMRPIIEYINLDTHSLSGEIIDLLKCNDLVITRLLTNIDNTLDTERDSLESLLLGF
jgi:HD-GYP domain-containing protein (c-di-GMP phosphodiesterase class II)